MSDDLQKLLEKLRVEVSRIREQGDIDITRFDWVEHADEIERIAYGIESALSSLPSQSGERNGPLHIDAEYFAMEILFHIDEMYPKMWEGVPNTARTSVRNTIINKLVVLNASAQASLESLKLEIRKQAFEEAAEHEPGEYLGCRGYDWECRCGTCGVWRGATNWPERIRWPDHIRALASAPAVPEKEKNE